MTKGQMIEYELVTRAVKATDTEGTSLHVSHFLQEMQEWLGEVERADVVDALKRLFWISYWAFANGTIQICVSETTKKTVTTICFFSMTTTIYAYIELHQAEVI